ncbi:mechanosensitive ion channel family protein [Roseofilum reptotaenium CS-1145]|uniref:Mechanosensitive ion channel protein MscS n=1 Tax=Roseofilum reptotaenium AO1-A TaxID=1925591 RepID=A0A1L9QMK5_9CYAN|nr:mechanosensitive ion channel family protein [Roseofilum reptotaenium]MDB9516702.1 mechanosensitive ion channel family protein [Roseofilum reptotaenium CS-1145]OJJ22667.1 hypothetical protein BI308_19575 [Roseofilum reptotaenium AO1-A]
MKIVHFIGIAVCVAYWVIAVQPLAIAQFSFIGQPPISSPPYNTPWWDLNKAQPCGQDWCSEVHLYSHRILEPELKLAVPSNFQSENPEPAIIEVEQRAKLVQSLLNTGINKTLNNHQFPHNSEPKSWNFWSFWNHDKPQHPLTLRLAIGKIKNQTVIYAPPQPELGLLISGTIVTVTEIDSRANFTSIEELAKTWQTNLELAFSEILWGREFDARYPWIRLKMSILTLLLTLIIFMILHVAREKVTVWRREFKKKTQTLVKLLESDSQENSGESIDSKNIDKFLELSDWKLIARLDSAKDNNEDIFSQIFFIHQINNSIELLRRILLILQPSALFFCLAVIFGLFRTTRFLTITFSVQAVLLPAIWMLITLIDKIFDFIIDHALNEWAKEMKEVDTLSNRYTLRVTTYSPAIKGGKHALFLALGIYITINLLGVSIKILASMGVLTVVLAFISRNLLEDMLNGILILWTDRYARGDFVEINNFSGTVEIINLYVTHLRNLDGQLIIIPNGQVSTVINSTKDWSRSNLTIKIALGADLKKAMETIKQVSNELQKDEEWKDKILEPVNILGVDDISHEGSIIRFLIKTVPGEQWAVSRTFRLRIKKALDEAGISLGIPQQIWYTYRSDEKLHLPISIDPDDS